MSGPTGMVFQINPTNGNLTAQPSLATPGAPPNDQPYPGDWQLVVTGCPLVRRLKTSLPWSTQTRPFRSRLASATGRYASKSLIRPCPPGSRKLRPTDAMSLAELRVTQLYVIMRDDRVPNRDRLEGFEGEIWSRRFRPAQGGHRGRGEHTNRSVRRGAGQTDLQFRLRCRGCNRWSGFRITIFDNRTLGDSSKPRLERVVVAGE